MNEEPVIFQITPQKTWLSFAHAHSRHFVNDY